VALAGLPTLALDRLRGKKLPPRFLIKFRGQPQASQRRGLYPGPNNARCCYRTHEGGYTVHSLHFTETSVRACMYIMTKEKTKR
jgi:hypothetical protein